MDTRITRQIPLDAGQADAFKGESNRRRIADQDLYFNSQFESQKPFYLEPGQSVWSEDPSQMIVTTVGSGVIVSIHDEELGMGAVGYILVPDRLMEFFPNFEKADKVLLEEALAPLDECVGHMKRHGAAKNRIRIRLIGGGTAPGDRTDKGTKNYIFVKQYIARKGLTLLNEDLGGAYIRRVHYFPTTGRCVRRILRRDSDFAFIRDLEMEYQIRLAAEN